MAANNRERGSGHANLPPGQHFLDGRFLNQFAHVKPKEKHVSVSPKPWLHNQLVQLGVQAAEVRSRSVRMETTQTDPALDKNEQLSTGEPSEPNTKPAESADEEREGALSDLKSEGFTVDEARRLLDIESRLRRSAEARESEATLRRLRFTRWLVEHGRLDEWSA